MVIPRDEAALAAETAASAASVVANFKNPVPLGLLFQQETTIIVHKKYKLSSIIISCYFGNEKGEKRETHDSEHTL